MPQIDPKNKHKGRVIRLTIACDYELETVESLGMRRKSVSLKKLMEGGEHDTRKSEG